MKKLILLLLLQGTIAHGQTCVNCVLNTSTPQNAQFNVGTGTVRGTLTVGSLITSNLTVGSLTVTSISGSGAGLTNLPAASLTGTINTARIAGAYTGITQVGTLTAGVWNASILSTQYGGTGQNFVNVSTGDLIYFNGVGTMAALTPGAPQQLLQSNGFAAPSWTGAPAVNGQNIQNVQTQYLSTGTLPFYVKVDDPSILAVSGSKVLGNINGFAVSVSSPIGIYQLAPGILPFVIPASSITPTGVVSGTYGASNVVPQFTVGADGRLRSVTNLIIPGVSTATARVDVDNNWQHAQTSISSWTIPSLKVTGTVTAGFFVGDGSGLFNIPTNIVSATGTLTQFAYFAGQHTLISSGAFTLSNTTMRVGNLNTPLPTTDVHLVVGNGPRAYNLNPSEDPVYLELASAAGAQAMMGFSKNGTQLMHIGLSPATNWLFYDDDIGGGLGTALKYSIGTGHWTFGNPASGEGGVLTPTTLGIYGVLTMFGTSAIVAPSSLTNGTLYFNSGSNHYQFSENAGAYVTLPGLTAQAVVAGAIPYFSASNGTYLTNDVSFTTSTILADFTAVAASTAALNVRLTAAEATIAALVVSTQSLQSQVNVVNVTLAQVQNQFNQVALSTAVIAFSTGTLQAQIFGLFASTGNLQALDAQLSQSTFSLQAQINNIVVSSASLQAQINVLSISTASLQSQINNNNAIIAALSLSTASEQVQITALGASTATEAAARIAGDAAVQVQVTALGASTNTLNAAMLASFNAVGSSTNSLQAGLTAVGASTASLQVQLTNVGASTAANQIQITAIGASTAALHTVDLAVGNSTASLQIQLTNVGASTAANQVQITALGASTNTLNSVKASTGTNADITALTALLQIGGYVFFANNKVVIGTSTVGTADLTIVQITSVAGLNIDHYSSDQVGSAVILRKAEGTINAPTAVLAGDRLGTFGALGWDGSLIFPSSSTARLVFTSTENFTSTAHGTFAQILTTPSGSTTPVVSATFGPGAFIGGNGSGLTAIHNSSCTTILNTTFSNTSFGPAISTVTLTSILAGSHVRISFSGKASNNTNSADTNVTVLVDGAFSTTIGNASASGFNNPTPGAAGVLPTANNFSFSVLLDADTLGAGTHTFAFAPNVSAGTGTLIKTATSNNRFCAVEEK